MATTPGALRSPRRILLVRTSALGDVVHNLPVLQALRQALPQAHIGWAIEEAFAPLLAGHPGLDEVLRLRLRSWRKSCGTPATRRDMRRHLGALRAFRPDLAIDLMGNHKSGVLCFLSGAPRRIGARKQDRREPSSALWINEAVTPTGEHAVDRALSLLAPLGITPGEADFGRSHILAAGVPLQLGHILIHPGAGWPSKRLPAQRWGMVVRLLHEKSGAPVLIAQAPGEEALASAVALASKQTGQVVPAPSLEGFAALARGSRLVLGSDSGPVHLAHALGVPVLMLMGPTLPSRHGPYAAPERALGLDLPCRGCYRRFTEEKACLSTLLAESIVGKALEIMRPVTLPLLH